MDVYVTRKVSGLNSRDKIEKYKELTAKRIAEGWQETPNGLLPIEEIRKAGFRWIEEEREVWDYDRNEFVMKPIGFGAIPTEEYIADGLSSDRKAGEKYIGASQQYLAWKTNYEERQRGSYDIDTAIEAQQQLDIPKEQPVVADEVVREEAVDSNGDLDPTKILF